MKILSDIKPVRGAKKGIMHKKICATANLTSQTIFSKSNKQFHEKKMWAKNEKICSKTLS